jgi:hypothetical protein
VVGHAELTCERSGPVGLHVGLGFHLSALLVEQPDALRELA